VRSFVWLIFMFVAILNGAFRVGVLISRVGEATAHGVSTLMLCVIITLVLWVSIVWLNPTTPAQTGAIAGLWVLMTVAFEFGFGHFVAGKSWAVLLADYNVLRGRVWLLVLIVLAEAPYRTARLRVLF
jgi:hypothetical protein